MRPFDNLHRRKFPYSSVLKPYLTVGVIQCVDETCFYYDEIKSVQLGVEPT